MALSLDDLVKDGRARKAFLQGQPRLRSAALGVTDEFRQPDREPAPLRTTPSLQLLQQPLVRPGGRSFRNSGRPPGTNHSTQPVHQEHAHCDVTQAFERRLHRGAHEQGLKSQAVAESRRADRNDNAPSALGLSPGCLPAESRCARSKLAFESTRRRCCLRNCARLSTKRKSRFMELQLATTERAPSARLTTSSESRYRPIREVEYRWDPGPVGIECRSCPTRWFGSPSRSDSTRMPDRRTRVCRSDIAWD